MSPDEASGIAAGLERRGSPPKQGVTGSHPDAELVALGQRFEALSAELALLQKQEADKLALVAERGERLKSCLLYTSQSPRDRTRSRMPSSA